MKLKKICSETLLKVALTELNPRRRKWTTKWRSPLLMTYFLSAPPWDNLPSPPLHSSNQFTHTHTHTEWCCCLLLLLARCLSTWKFLPSAEDILLLSSGTCVHLLGARVAWNAPVRGSRGRSSHAGDRLLFRGPSLRSPPAAHISNVWPFLCQREK